MLRLAPVAISCVFILSTVDSVFGQEYTVTRSFDQDSTLCEGASTSVTLRGEGPGAGGDLLTITEELRSEGGVTDLVITEVSHGGEVGVVVPTDVGVFDSRGVVQQGEPRGPGSGTESLGGDSYLSSSQTGHDVWSGGDTFEFAYSKFDGDFDVSVRIDNYDHSTGFGCWGKFGIMARQTLEPRSRFVWIQNHGPTRGGDEGSGPCVDHPSGRGTQATGVLGRYVHNPAPKAGGGEGEYFELVYDAETGINPAFYHEIDGQPFPTQYFEFQYLRLTRRGEEFDAWASNDPDVEDDPTDDTLWVKFDPGVEGDLIPLLAQDGGSCWYVGFANSSHTTSGDAIQNVEFTTLRWEGDSCFDGNAEPEALRITWTDVSRSDVSAGLSYSVESMPTDAPFTTHQTNHEGSVEGGDAETVEGPATADVTGLQEIGDLLMRPIGPSGAGSAEFDGSVYTMTGRGLDIWNGGDHMNFLYTPVVGDFDAIALVENVDMSEGGQWGKYGLMARESCHFDSRYDFIQANASESQGARFSLRNDHRPAGAGGSNEKGIVDEILPGAPGALADPEYLRLIRTGSQISGYIAWDDPENPGTPFHWSLVGQRNVEGRAELYHLGMAINSFNDTTFNSLSFLLDVAPYEVPPVDPGVLMDGAVLFERDFDTEADGNLPEHSFRGSRGSGSYRPVVMDGRLRMTDESVEDAAGAIWFKDKALASLLNTGFVAEYDISITRSEALESAGEGGMFVVMASASGLVAEEDGCAAGDDPNVIDAVDTLGHFIGTDFGAVSESSVDDGGTPNDPTDDIYTNVSSSGAQVWQDCDDFNFDYSEVTGDFDVAIEILEQRHETNQGEWGKQGIMARESLTRQARFFMINDTYPGDTQPSWVTYRPTVAGGDECDDTREIATPFTHPRFLRLTRRGDTFRGWVSNDPGLGDGTLDPHQDCNWFGAHEDTIEGMAETLVLGICNADDVGAGPIAQTLVYRFLPANPGGAVLDTSRETDLVGYPRELGFGHLDVGTEPNTEGSVPTTGLRAVSESRPMLAVEIDTRVSEDEVGGGKAIEGSGSPENPGTYHIGVNVAAIAHSRQTNEDFGVDAEDLPDVFDRDSPVRMRLEYRPNGEVRVWANDLPVINTYIPPLNLGAGVDDPLVGFVGSTIAGASQTLEFDNLVIKRLGEGGGGTVFRRGDADDNGNLELTDAIAILSFLFTGGREPGCLEAADAANDGDVGLTDAIRILTFLFQGGVPLAEPQECGLDTDEPGSPGDIGCDTFESCG